MASQAFELAILLSLKDAASGGLNRVESQLRSLGKEGKHTLQTFEDLRRDLKRDLTLASVGVGGLALLKGGIMAAADYESALLDLKSAYQEVSSAGGASATEQASQLNQLEHLAVGLGNRLQGNTSNYVQILAALRKAGVDTKTVIGGAGEAAANLANVSGALLSGQATEQAKQLGQFGKMFKLKPEEFEKSVNLFSALKDRFDVESSSLIESAKYFQATSNQLNITGIGGAEETLKLFALLKRQGGLEGSMAGTGARSFFTNVITEKKKIAALKKDTGIDLSQMFDVKTGEFKGFENALAIMEKFRKLTPEKRVGALNAIFGERGGEVASVMVEAGVEGWKAINAETAKAVPVNEKINQQMETTSAKLEAIQGSLTNLVATGFTPMLNTVKPMLDLTNNLVGEFQEFGATYPGVASVATHLFGIGSASLAAYASVRALTTAWKLWRIASTITSNESMLLSFLRGTGTESAGAAAKVGGLGGALRGLPKTVQITLLIASIGYTLDQLFELKKWIDEWNKSESNINRSGKEDFKALSRLEQTSAKAGKTVDPKLYKESAASAFSALNIEGGTLRDWTGIGGASLADQARDSFQTFALHGANKLINLWFNSVTGGVIPGMPGALHLFTGKDDVLPDFFPMHMKSDKERSAFIRQRAPILENPKVMAESRKQLEGMKLGPEVTQTILKWWQQAFPKSFDDSTKILTGNLQDLAKPTFDLTTEFTKLQRPVSTFPTAMDAARLAALDFAKNVGKLNLFPPSTGDNGGTGGTTNTTTGGTTTTVKPPSLLNSPLIVKPHPTSPVEIRKSHASLSSLREIPATPQLKTLSLPAPYEVARNRESSSRQSEAIPHSVRHVRKNYSINIIESSNARATADAVMRELERREARS